MIPNQCYDPENGFDGFHSFLEIIALELLDRGDGMDRWEDERTWECLVLMAYTNCCTKVLRKPVNNHHPRKSDAHNFNVQTQVSRISEQVHKYSS